jgi:hypothetical protein
MAPRGGIGQAIRENLLGETPFVAVVGHVPFLLGWQPLQADGKQWSHRGIDVLEAVPFTTPRAAPWGALAVSFVVHLTCFGIGASIVISPKPAATNLTGIIQADIDPVVAVAEPVLLSLSELNPTAGGGGKRQAAPLTMLAEAPAESQWGGFRMNRSIEFGEGEGLSYTDVIADGGSGGGSGGGDGLGVGTGSGNGTGEGFFGMDLAGERFVFVVDASRSMNHPYPGEAKNRLGRVKIELYNTIRKLTPDQSFFVVFFNSEPIPMQSRGMVKADPAMIQRHLEWIFSARGNGQTNPESALHMALRLAPDKIYFLTDGDFSYRSVRSVREFNQGRIPIHTIGFGGQGGEKNLQEMARDSRGTYQFIPEPVMDNSPSLPTSKTAASNPTAQK